MKKETGIDSAAKNNTDRLNCRRPDLFFIPLNEYADEMKKPRNKEQFVKMQQLEKNSRLLFDDMQLLLKAHRQRVVQTHEMINFSCEVNNKFIESGKARKKHPLSNKEQTFEWSVATMMIK